MIWTPDAALCSALSPSGCPFGDGLRRARRQGESLAGCLASPAEDGLRKAHNGHRITILIQAKNCLADGVHFRERKTK
jgi:hypothetical protein